ncbi:lysine--tRNA ligase [Geoglobus acetivorans]|uniref:Lysine--tRNA ligase n=1 Tax=Geoglobus acetivorans TaxID=565033 RepID=A0A0A7GEF1_GEOAI|nr:Lysyl-tRNA synthetase (class I) [Geoglobus acetivorans]
MSDIIHWADVIAERILSEKDSVRIATGITPSGHIHLGNLREMLTADAIRRAIDEKGGKAEIVYIADTFDPLRKRYPFLPEEYENYVGMPLSRIPDPEGCHENYAEHFLQPFLESLEILGIPVTLKKAHEMYESGEYTGKTRTALEKKDEIAKILKEVSGRDVEDGWSPFMPVCKNCGRLNSTRVTGFDGKKVSYICRSCGHEGESDLTEGKLVWRVDWPARWGILGINVEPFGKDHAAAGGSYDTGKRIAKEIFGIEPPFPIVYEWINLKGKGAMKSSKGIVVPVREMVEILPPEIVRYIIIRSKPERHIEFDPGIGLLDVVDEFENAYHQGDRSVELSLVENVVYSDVPFRHLLVVGQIAEWDLEKVLEILERNGHEIDEDLKRDVERRLKYARKWLEKYAPENLKFSVKKSRDEIKSGFSEDEKRFLNEFAGSLEDDMDAEKLHKLVYEVAQKVGIKPEKAFQAIYKAILDTKHGPRAGYFLSSLGVDFVRKRFMEI